MTVPRAVAETILEHLAVRIEDVYDEDPDGVEDMRPAEIHRTKMGRVYDIADAQKWVRANMGAE